MRTIYRKIRTYGLLSYRPRLTLLLTWCQERAHWNQEWNHVVYSGESRFCLWAYDGRKKMKTWRKAPTSI
nr:unnamed protein product [Callosobruchus chinensis]